MSKQILISKNSGTGKLPNKLSKSVPLLKRPRRGARRLSKNEFKNLIKVIK